MFDPILNGNTPSLFRPSEKTQILNIAPWRICCTISSPWTILLAGYALLLDVGMFYAELLAREYMKQMPGTVSRELVSAWSPHNTTATPEP